MREYRIGRAKNYLPKTGQTTSYADGDDGDVEAGLSIVNRFEVVTIGSDTVVKDYATRLMWAQNGTSSICNDGLSFATWEDARAFVNGRSFAGFTDWRMPNVLESLTINDYGSTESTQLYSVFVNQYNIMTSTTNAKNTAQCYVHFVTTGAINARDKTLGERTRPCRSF